VIIGDKMNFRIGREKTEIYFLLNIGKNYNISMNLGWFFIQNASLFKIELLEFFILNSDKKFVLTLFEIKIFKFIIGLYYRNY